MIRTQALTKDFVVSRTRTVHAVRGISLDVEPGELVAVLGPNGAGKTTTLRMLTTLIAPTRAPPGRRLRRVADAAAVRRRIGYVGQGNGAGHTSGSATSWSPRARSTAWSRAARGAAPTSSMEALDLTEQADRKGRALSGGQQRRLDVAVGLVHEPSLLFLDEPSTGLDPQNRANLWEHILRMRGATHEHDHRPHHALPRRGRHDRRAGHRGRPRRGHRGRHRRAR